jgi:HD-GYP domain-containing protein (c-di-GMP phosphodiesterase class II)
MLIAGDSTKQQRETEYYSNATYRHPSQVDLRRKEALEAFMKMPRGQWDSGVVDSFLQILGQQVMTSQVPTLVET